jgi:hypothetical protein
MKKAIWLSLIFILAHFSEAYSASWEQVNREGFDSMVNYGVIDDSFAIFNGRLYAGTDNPCNGPEVWVYENNGTLDWTNVSADSNNPGKSIFFGGEGTQFILEFDGYLYAGTVGAIGGNCGYPANNGQIWRTEDEDNWEKVFDYADWVLPSETGDVMSAIIFKGALYISGRAGSHPEIYRSVDGISWEKIVDENSLDADLNILYAYPFEIFNDELYAGFTNKINGGEIWKSADGENWTQVNTNGMTADIYQKYRYMIRQLIVFNGTLYATVVNGKYSGTVTIWRWIEVWKSQNGTDWSQIGGNGFGDPANNQDGRGAEVYNDCLYIGSGGYSIPGYPTVYRTCNGSNFEEIGHGEIGDGDSLNNGVMALKSFEGYLYAATYRYNGSSGGTEVWRYKESNTEPDSDNDSIPDSQDNCPTKPNGPSLGTCLPNSDKAGSACHSDADCVFGCSTKGTCSLNQEDTDSDGKGDVCDNCPTNCNSEQRDADSDGIGDVCDTDPGCGGCSGVECEQQCH